MVKILEEYTGEHGDGGISTETWVNLLVSMTDLNSEHVERLEDSNKGITKYRLSENLLSTLNKTAVELQVFVERAAGLIEERTRYFTVDLKDTLSHFLRGTSSLPQLNVAWKAMQKHLELGHRTLQKYALQYQQSPQEEELLLSPISTLPDIHTGLQDLLTADQRLRYLYQNFPHHREQLTPQAESALDQSKPWTNVLPLPDSLKSVLIPEDEYREQRRGAQSSKGKQKERRIEPDDENEAAADGIWLGSDTPYKGPNKWLGGGRLKPRLTISSATTAAKTSKANQNVLFGIATPQIPIWADDSPSDAQKQGASSSRRLREWPNRQPPPHLSSSNHRRSSIPSNNRRGNESARRRPNEDPPDDEGDDGDEGGSNRGRPSRRNSRNPRREASDSGSSRRGRRGQEPPSELSDGDDSSSRSESDDDDSTGIVSGSEKRKATIPYGQIKPTIKTEIKQEALPRWDGNPNTAVQYFMKIQQLAALEGDLPEALGYWLWMNLEDGSDIKDWFSTLTFEEQAHMRSHYINYLRGIKDGYLGEAWQAKINRVYEGQYFRQIGHEKELPKTFIIRRIMYTRMLTSAKPGGKLEISLIMRRAPISWKTILVLESIKSTKTLYTKVVDHEDALLEAWKRKVTSTSAITVENLLPNLRRLGWEPPRSTIVHSNTDRLPTDRRVLLTVAEEDEQEPRSEVSHVQEEKHADSHDDMLREVYQVMQKRQRAPPPGGYMFSRNDHVTTKMGKLPPSPCHACGSSNHWDKECPDWEVYRAQVASTKRTARNIEKEPETEESDKLYQSAYSILLSQRLASTQIDLDRLSSDFESAVRLSNVTALSVEGAISERKTGESRQMDVEEIVDEAVEIANAMKTSEKYLLIHESEAHEKEPLPAIKHPAQTPRKAAPISMEEVEDDFWDEYRSKPKSTNHILEENLLATEEANEPTRTVHTSVTETFHTAKSSEHPETSIPLPSPPKEIKPVRMPKK